MSLSSVLGKLTVLFLDESANVISEENIYIYREREVGWEFLFPAWLPELPGAGHSCRGWWDTKGAGPWAEAGWPVTCCHPYGAEPPHGRGPGAGVKRGC